MPPPVVLLELHTSLPQLPQAPGAPDVRAAQLDRVVLGRESDVRCQMSDVRCLSSPAGLGCPRAGMSDVRTAQFDRLVMGQETRMSDKLNRVSWSSQMLDFRCAQLDRVVR